MAKIPRRAEPARDVILDELHRATIREPFRTSFELVDDRPVPRSDAARLREERAAAEADEVARKEAEPQTSEDVLAWARRRPRVTLAPEALDLLEEVDVDDPDLEALLEGADVSEEEAIRLLDEADPDGPIEFLPPAEHIETALEDDDVEGLLDLVGEKRRDRAHRRAGR